MELFKIILGFLLHLANRDIMYNYKHEFYQFKNKLLSKYGKPYQVEFQHIIKHCYSCKNGIFYCSWKKPETCWSCNGTSIYDEFWVKLMKYKLGRHYFHLPTTRYYDYIEFTKARKKSVKNFRTLSKPIEGYINHKAPKYGLGIEAQLLLALFNNPVKLLKSLGYFRRMGAITPLLLLNNLIFYFRFECIHGISNFFKNIGKKKISIFYSVNSDDDLPF